MALKTWHSSVVHTDCNAISLMHQLSHYLIGLRIVSKTKVPKSFFIFFPKASYCWRYPMPPREPIKQTPKQSCHGQDPNSDLAVAKFFRFSDESLLKACRYSVRQVNCFHPTHPTSSLAFFSLHCG